MSELRQHTTVEAFFLAGRESLKLDIAAGGDFLRRAVREAALNRTGLAFAGVMEHFPPRRLQICGLAEMACLQRQPTATQEERLRAFFSRGVPALILTRGKKPTPAMDALAAEFRTPLLRTRLDTNRFMQAAAVLIEDLVAPRLKVQGTMVDIHGIGVLLEGEPGIGKSETALGLVARGYSLIADDLTQLKRTPQGTLRGAAVELTRYHMEIRGLGIIHVPSLFGVASIRPEKQLDLIVRLVRPDGDGRGDERTGLSHPTRAVLGADIPVLTIPVSAGRDMAPIVEVAALNYRLRQLGHDAAKELDQRVMEKLGEHHAGD